MGLLHLVFSTRVDLRILQSYPEEGRKTNMLQCIHAHASFRFQGGGKSNDKKMAAVGLWRQISLWLWLSCLLLAVYSAPVNEDGPIVEVNDQSDNDNDLGPAIEAIGKAKREARKRSSLRSSNGRTHYRFPNTIKRSMHDGSDDYDTDGEEEFSDSMAAYLAAADDDSTVDLDDLAKEIALNILMEEADKSRENPPASSLKKKKMAPVAHRPRNNSADDKRRKRMNSLMNQLLEERERGEVEESDDYDNQQMAEHPAGPDDNNEANESLVGSEGDQDEEDDSDEVVSSRTELRKLFNDGLERHEINALLSQLDRSRADSEELNKSEKKKKRSGSDWRKLPRASLRWRFLHSQGQESNEPSYGRQQSADDDELQDKNVAFEDRFFGRGFHRVGNIQDEPIRNNPEETAKRVQHPLKTKNAISVIRKRSIATLQNSGEKKPEAGSALQMLRKRRNSEAKAAEENNNKNETAPLALPSAQANNNSNSSPVKRKSDVQVHTGVIRKKSVDWDDYFGYDKRSGKAQGEPNEEAMRNYLESDYYKSMAGSLAFRKRGQMDDQHAGHVVGMKKRNNVTSTSWEKKKKRFRPVEGYNADDAEDVLDAAIRVIEERRERNNIDRVREQLVAELVDNLDENELNQMTERLTEEVAKALYQEEEEEEEDDERDEFKRSSTNQKLKNKKKKKNMSQNDERRKRFAVKRSSRHRSGFNVAESNGKKNFNIEKIR